MSEHVSDSKHFENKYDNADLQSDRTTKDLAAAYTQYDEMRAYKTYLETLELEAKISASAAEVESRVVKADGTVDTVKLKIKDLISEQSEFEAARRRVLVKLNTITRGAGGAAKMKQLYAEFETESNFELSSKITNYLMDKTRRDRVANEFKLL
jgi:hypothetical protein